MKKKVLFVMPGLYSGGAEKSLVNLLNLLDYSKLDVDLLLFKKEGLFMNQVPSEVNILNIPISLKYSYNYCFAWVRFSYQTSSITQSVE